MSSPLPRAVLGAAMVLASLASPAMASTWTVDDDGAQCPNAAFTHIQDAVDQAAPNDTVIVCDGLYQEHSTPTNGSYSPTQPGARNGLTIQKPLTIKGTGASKVTIEPDPSLGASLAGTAPYLRDGGGNVITIARQSLGSSDDNENRVDISGVTIRSPYAYAEAGVAYFNTSGTLDDVVVGPLRRAAPDDAASRPYGWGVVQTNSLQGGGPGSGTVRREVSIVDSLITGYQAGGVLFDGARGADGTPESATAAGIAQYGNVLRTKIVGDADGGIPQVGVRYAYGTRGRIEGSEIVGNGWSSTSPAATSYGVQLAGANTGLDADVPGARALRITGTTFERNRIALLNAEEDGSTVRLGAPVSTDDNWFGCTTGPLVGATSNANSGCQGISGNDAGTPPAPSVELGTVRTAVPASLAVPGAPADLAPTVAFRDPNGPVTIAVGQSLAPVVLASDDFGISRVTLTAGAATSVRTRGAYQFAWAPTAADAGTTVALTATATDSSGHSTTATLPVTVLPLSTPTPAPSPTPAPVPAPSAAAPPMVLGSAEVGETVVCLVGAWTGAPSGYAYQWLRAGTAITGATANAYELSRADTASEISCRVTAAGAGGLGTATSTGRLVRFATVFDSSAGDTRQIGPAILDGAAKVSVSRKTGKGAIGSLSCVRALATTCTVTITGTIKIGSRTWKLPSTSAEITGRDTLEVLVPRSARLRLTGRRTGRLSLRVAVTDQTGFKGSVKVAFTARGKR